MSERYFPPTKGASSFNCPHCQVVAHQRWLNILKQDGALFNTEFTASVCAHCSQLVYWYTKTGWSSPLQPLRPLLIPIFPMAAARTTKRPAKSPIGPHARRQPFVGWRCRS